MRRNEKGFTLVELLIVLAIIAALSTVLVPNIPRWTNSAKAGVVESDISQIANAMIQYVNSEGGEIDAGGTDKIVDLSASDLKEFFTKEPTNPFDGSIWVKTTSTDSINGAAGRKYGFIMYDHLPSYVANKIKNDLGDTVTKVQKKADGGTIPMIAIGL
jgi:prepilin-type N-terminal cleavage/methylation domain-containing protein